MLPYPGLVLCPSSIPDKCGHSYYWKSDHVPYIVMYLFYHFSVTDIKRHYKLLFIFSIPKLTEYTLSSSVNGKRMLKRKGINQGLGVHIINFYKLNQQIHYVKDVSSSLFIKLQYASALTGTLSGSHNFLKRSAYLIWLCTYSAKVYDSTDVRDVRTYEVHVGQHLIVSNLYEFKSARYKLKCQDCDRF